jgi:hypothetical protein
MLYLCVLLDSTTRWHLPLHTLVWACVCTICLPFYYYYYYYYYHHHHYLIIIIIIIIFIIIIIVSIFLTMLLTRLFLNFQSFIPCTTEDCVMMSCCIPIHSISKFHPSLVDIIGIWVLACNFRNSTLFTATCKTSPSDRRFRLLTVSVQTSISLRNTCSTSINEILPQSVAFLYQIIYVFIQGFRFFSQYISILSVSCRIIIP